MKIYKTQQEVEKDIKDGTLNLQLEDVTFKCDIDIEASIVNARNIKAKNIRALNINAWDIKALNINALNINASDINAFDINAKNILYYAFCNIYKNLTCESIEGIRENHAQPVCLDGKLTIKKPEPEEMTLEEVCKELGREIKIKK